MTLLPKVKLKAQVNFPATVLDGTGIDVTKSNGTYRFDLDFGDFAPPVTSLTDPTHQNVLLWNDQTGQYNLISTAALGGTFQHSGAGAVIRTPQEKARDFVTPEDFGAIGDGTADDSAAFTLAFASHRVVHGRAGSLYRVKDLVLNANEFYGNGCGFRPAVGARWMLKLTGYKPRLASFFVQDENNYALRTTLASSPIVGATSFTVASATGLEVRMIILIYGDTDPGQYNLITGIAGTTITVRDPLTAPVSAGVAVVAFHGSVVVEDANFYAIEDAHWVNAYAALVLKPSSSSATAGKGSIKRIRADGCVYTGFAKFENSHDVSMEDVQLWGGYVDTTNAVGNGTAGPFFFNEKVFLRRDVTVTVDGVAKTRPTQWEYASSTTIAFTAGNFPAVGAAVAVSHYQHGFRGFIEDQRNTTIISGGNRYSKVSILAFRYGLQLAETELTDFDELTIDTCQYSTLVMSDLGTTDTVRFGQTLLSWSANSIKAFASATVIFDQLFTIRVPAIEAYLGATDDNIAVDSTSKISIDAAAWNGTDYQINGAGKVFFKNGKVFNSTTASTVAAASTIYLGPLGVQTVLGVAPFMSPADGTLLELRVECGTAPGGGQTFTYTAQINEVDVSGSSVVISGAASFSNSVRFVGAINQYDRVTVKLVTSAGAAASHHRVIIVGR